MDEKWNEVKTQKLSPAEIENLISREYGAKIQPVDAGQLAKKYRSDAIRRAARAPLRSR
jgi:hypothetical protein